MHARLLAGPGAAVAAVALWSTNAYAAGEVLARTTVLQLLTVQYGSAALVLVVARWALARCAARRRPTLRAVADGPADAAGGAATTRAARLAPVAVGVLGLTGTIFLQYLAFDTAPLVGANVICYADGLIAALWVAAWRPSRHTLIGVPLALLGFAGVVVVLTEGFDLGGVALGYLFALGSATGMAFYSLASGRLRASTFDMLIPATVVGALVAGALSLARGEAWPAFADWAGAIYIGLGPMAAGYAFWTYAMSEGRADRLIPLSYATPLLSTGLLLATGQPFTTRTLLGAALILLCSTGVLLNQWHHTRSTRERGVETTSAATAARQEGVRTR